MRYSVKKIKERSGASIIMGLLLVLVCTMVSSVIIAAAGTASRNAAFKREQQQAYLSVSSAARLLTEDICNCTMSKKDPDTLAPKDGSKPAAFIPLLKKAIQLAKERQEGAEPEPIEFTMNFSDSEKIYPVKVKFTVPSAEKLDITANLSTEYVVGKTKTEYKMTASMKYEKDCFEVTSIKQG